MCSHRSVLIKIYPLCHGESFHLSLLHFLFDWWVSCQWIVQSILTTSRYIANGQIHVYLIGSSIKIVTKHNVFAMYQFKSDRMISSWDLHASFWVLWFANTAAAKIVSTYGDKLVYHFYHISIHVMNYKICNI